MTLNPFELIKSLTHEYNILNSYFFSDRTLMLVYIGGEECTWTISTSDSVFIITQDQSDMYEIRMVVGEEMPSGQMPKVVEQIPLAQSCLPGKLVIQDTGDKDNFLMVYVLRVSRQMLTVDLDSLLTSVEDDIRYFMSGEDDDPDSEGLIINFDKLGKS